MKVLSLVLVAVLSLGVILCGEAYARNEGWYIAGGVLAGLATASIISDSRSHCYSSRPVYVRPVSYHRPVYRYDSYYTYSYPTYYSTSSVYDHEVVRVW